MSWIPDMWRKTARPEINFNIGGEPEEPEDMSHQDFYTAWGYHPVTAAEMQEQMLRHIQQAIQHQRTLNAIGHTLKQIDNLPVATTEELQAAYPHARTDKLGSRWSSRYTSESQITNP